MVGRGIHILCFVLGALLCANVASAQSATVSQDDMDERDIRNGGKRIEIDLSGVNFSSFTDQIKRDIINGLSGGPEFELVKAKIPLSNVERRTNRKARITLAATSGYFIGADEYVSVVIPASALFFYYSPLDATPDVLISNRNTDISFSGSILSSTSETDIRNGGPSLVITADYNHWRPELAGSDVASVRDLFDDGHFRQQVASRISSTNVTVNKNVLTISIPAGADYYLGEDETVSVTVTGSCFIYPEPLNGNQVKFDIDNDDPLVTLQNVEYGEEEIRSGNRTFTITMSGDKFENPLNVNELRNDFSGGAGWESDLENTLTFSRNNDFQVVATIPRFSGFDIDVPEQVSLSLGHENIKFTTSSSFSDPVNRITLIPLVPTLTIQSVPSPLNEDNLDGSVLRATLTETRLTDNSLSASDLQIIPAIPGLVINNPVNVTSNYFEVPLSFSGNLEDDASVTLILDGSQILYGSDLTSNTLSLSSAYEPQVTSVSIPNVPMGTGDVVTVTITFTDNNEQGVFVYEGGTIEGEPLVADSVKKINSTTYTSVFIIREDTPNRRADQSIRVVDLQFSNGVNQGIPVDYNIVQDHDEIDTEAPVIDYIRYADGNVHIIGVPVVGTVVADGADYQFDNSRSYINGVSFSSDQIQVHNEMNNTYTVTYTPEEGDHDVGESDLIEVELVMIDKVGNRNDPPVGTLFMNYSPIIDANSPELDSAVVANPGVKAIGDQIEILLYATEPLRVPEPPITGTHVNFVPISSSNVVFEHVSGLVYRLLYTVALGDNGVNPGQLTYNLEMEDIAGNRNNSNTPLKNNNITIGSDIPTAAIVGGNSVCLGDSLQAFLHFTGTGPWNAVVSNNSGEYLTVTGVNSPYLFWIKTDEDDIFFVSSISDAVGNEGVSFGELEVTLQYPTEVEILLDRTTYLSSEPGVQLRASHEPGVFSGKGVSSGYFYPSIATTVGSPHTITYTYENSYGCVSHASADIEVVEGSGSVHLLSGTDTISVLCSGQGIYEIRGNNKDGIPGLFELRITHSATVIEGHIMDTDATDNMAVLDAYGLSGGYDIIYSYVIDNVTLSASTYFLVDELEQLEITSDLPAQVCKNDAPYLLTGNLDGVDPLATYSFTGPGVTGNKIYGFFYDPSSPDAPSGNNQITYSYTSSSGCDASLTVNVLNTFVPVVKFTPSTVCLAEDGGLVQFSNETSGKYAVTGWQWNFGDLGSGNDNYSTLEEPEHFYEEPGLRSISLQAITTEGCVAKSVQNILFADKPIADFIWLNDCFVIGENVQFQNTTESGFSAVETFTWTFKTEGGAILGSIISGPGEDTVSFPFTALGNYTIELEATNTGGCTDEISKEILLTPTVVLAQEGYKESFNESVGDWSVHSVDGVESWKWDMPNFEGYQQVPGDKAWFTDLPYGIVGYDESSWVQSPCMDFRKMKRPLIQVDIMKSFVPNLTGCVLQYQDQVEKGWKTVGLYQEGISWYNSNDIFKSPGGSKYGWGLNVFIPDTDWVTAKHNLDMLAGKKNVKLRFVIGTNGRQGIGNQGFAFDNLVIAERTKYSVLEHFTNSDDMNARAADNYVDSFYYDNMKDVIDLQYHMDYPGFDMMNENNPDPPYQRSSFYNVPQVPYSVLNGGTNLAYRYDFSDLNNRPGKEELQQISLEIPAFRIEIGVDWNDNSFDADINTTCQNESYKNNIQLYTVVIESSVTAYTGGNQDTMFRNVVLDMLPTQGSLLGGNWTKGQSVSRHYTWEYTDYVENVEDLAVVAYILDRETKRVLQTAASYLTTPVGIRNRFRPELTGMGLFPNPAGDFFYVNLGEDQVNKGELTIVDMSGRISKMIEIQPGYKIQKVGIEDLPQGIYMVCWTESGRLKARNKLIRAR